MTVIWWLLILVPAVIIEIALLVSAVLMLASLNAYRQDGPL